MNIVLLITEKFVGFAGVVAKEFFEKSKLPHSELSKIW